MTDIEEVEKVFEHTPETCPKHKWQSLTGPLRKAYQMVECIRCGKTGWRT